MRFTRQLSVPMCEHRTPLYGVGDIIVVVGTGNRHGSGRGLLYVMKYLHHEFRDRQTTVI